MPRCRRIHLAPSLAVALIACAGAHHEAAPPQPTPAVSPAPVAPAPVASPAPAPTTPLAVTPVADTRAATVRFLHASPDRNLPEADVRLDASPDAVITALPFASADGYQPIAPGAHTLSIYRPHADPAAQPLLDAASLPALSPARAYTAVLTGLSTVFSPGLALSVIEDTGVVPARGQGGVRWLHAYVALPTVDVCVGANAISTVAYGAWSTGPYVPLPPGDTRFQVRVHGDTPCTGSSAFAFSLRVTSDALATVVFTGNAMPPDSATMSSGAHKQRAGTISRALHDLVTVIRCDDPPGARTGCAQVTATR